MTVSANSITGVKTADRLDNVNTVVSEDTAVDRAALPDDALIDKEYLLYETKPILWLQMCYPLLCIFVGMVIVTFADRIPLGFIHYLSSQIALGLVHIIIKWVGTVIVFGGVLGIIYVYLRWQSTAYSITNLRVINHKGVIAKTYVATSLSKIQMLYLQIPMLGRIFNYGTIYMITASGDTMVIRWQGLRGSREIYRMLSQITEQCRIQDNQSK